MSGSIVSGSLSFMLRRSIRRLDRPEQRRFLAPFPLAVDRDLPTHEARRAGSTASADPSVREHRGRAARRAITGIPIAARLLSLGSRPLRLGRPGRAATPRCSHPGGVATAETSGSQWAESAPATPTPRSRYYTPQRRCWAATANLHAAPAQPGRARHGSCSPARSTRAQQPQRPGEFFSGRRTTARRGILPARPLLLLRLSFSIASRTSILDAVARLCR